MQAIYDASPSEMPSESSIFGTTEGFADAIASAIAFDPNSLHPPPPSPLFTGRALELSYIDIFYDRFEGELVVRGVPGSGKTQLALQYAQLRKPYR